MVQDAVMTAPARAEKAAPTFKVQDTITLTARLAQLLAEEVDLLSDMKVSSIEALQKEKLFIVSALDAQRKLLAKNPQLMESISPQDKRDLKEVVKVFDDMLAENHRRLLVAREINLKIVQAITYVVREGTASRVYDGKGMTGFAPYQTLSVTLNQKI